MRNALTNRRDFLRATAASTAGLALAVPWAKSALAAEPLVIDQPFHGAVLNRRHGRQTEEGLTIQVRGRAPLGDRVTVNDAVAQRAGARFSAEASLRRKETDIVAASVGSGGRAEHRVRVVWDKYSEPRYRFAIDDNILFLRDIARHGYRSLFDCHYLDMLRRLHRQYGALFVLNVYFAADDGFNLTQFPDRYRSEWRDNANWLKLAFHAHANDPSRPYQYASPQTVIADLGKVVEQILRFAGEETNSPTTLIHWAMTPPAVFQLLAQRGVRTLGGYFRRRDGGWDINYSLDDDRSEYLSRNDALKDFDSGIVFTKVDLVCNHLPSLEHVASTLAPLPEDPNQAEIMDLTTHEQPYWRDQFPDHAQRIETAIRWVTQRGYKPVFFHEGFLGGRDW